MEHTETNSGYIFIDVSTPQKMEAIITSYGFCFCEPWGWNIIAFILPLWLKDSKKGRQRKRNENKERRMC